MFLIIGATSFGTALCRLTDWVGRVGLAIVDRLVGRLPACSTTPDAETIEASRNDKVVIPHLAFVGYVCS